MKIPALLPFKVQYQNKNVKNQNAIHYKGFGDYRDFFIKQKTLNSNNRSFDYVFQRLKKDVVEYILNAERINDYELSCIIEKYFPNVRFDKFEEENSPIVRVMAEYVVVPQIEMLYGKPQITDTVKEMRINIPEEQDINSRLDFLMHFIHESTHMLQNEASDRRSWSDVVKEYFLPKIKNPRDLCRFNKIMEYLDNGFFLFENCIFEIIDYSVNTHDKKDINAKSIEKDLQEQYGLGFDEAVEIIILEAYKNNGLQKSDMPEESVILENIKYKLENELEAYKKESELLEEFEYPEFTEKSLRAITIVIEKTIKSVDKLLKSGKY